MKPIVLEAHPKSTECVGVVRLSTAAERVVRRLSYQTGIPIRKIVSDIIVQAEDLIEVRTFGTDTDSDSDLV